MSQTYQSLRGDSCQLARGWCLCTQASRRACLQISRCCSAAAYAYPPESADVKARVAGQVGASSLAERVGGC